ncbi:MAG TPA: ergot alkaloid biosynthesis protein [Spirillospora sp.]
MSGPVLVTGATGKTGRRLLAALRARGVPARAASRRPGEGRVHFDWTDRGTWNAAVDGAGSAYLVSPSGVADPASLVIEFVEAAMARGVARFVLLSASLLEAGGPAMGRVHQWLAGSASEWAVLRPSWFMQNFSEGPHRATIREEHAIYSATGAGRVPFISADDIAEAAAAVLTAGRAPNTDFVLTGPEPLDYAQVAARIGEAAGFTVAHKRVGAEELVARLTAGGLGEAHAQALAAMDVAIAAGAEDRTTPDLRELIGRPPTGFSTFVTDNVAAWTDRAWTDRRPVTGR